LSFTTTTAWHFAVAAGFTLAEALADDAGSPALVLNHVTAYSKN